jgi:hypothetical protein
MELDYNHPSIMALQVIGTGPRVWFQIHLRIKTILRFLFKSTSNFRVSGFFFFLKKLKLLLRFF